MCNICHTICGQSVLLEPVFGNMSQPALTEEMFDVFDENESLIGCERRSIVHQTGAWHRSTNVLLFDDRQQEARWFSSVLRTKMSVRCTGICRWLSIANVASRTWTPQCVACAKSSASRSTPRASLRCDAAPERFQYRIGCNTATTNSISAFESTSPPPKSPQSVSTTARFAPSIGLRRVPLHKPCESSTATASRRRKTFTPWMLREVALSLSLQ
jgi:hypothetical protein